ncbi:MAG: anthranilate phosphoribosyltransferase [Pseudomonadales bacterium]|nr:anthranilate phosphoribosyltransferase [Pseudomonadales bacterium]
MFKETLGRLTRAEELSTADITEFVENVHDNVITDIQIAGFLVGLLMKGPTAKEVLAIALSMRKYSVKINPNVKGNLLDTCGTGGGLNTFNVSTTNAILTASAGVPVAKHGSRSISGKSGSADVLEFLGITVELPPAQAQQLIEEIGISFLYGPSFNPIFLKLFGPEQALGIKTIFFTIMGPLLNPASATRQLLGVYQPHLVDLMADVVVQMPIEHCIIAHGIDGLDEISILGPTIYAEVKDGRITKHEVTPEDFGFKRATLEEVKGGDPQFNADIIQNIFEGRDRGPRRDFLVINNGFALYVAGVAASPQEGMEIAEKTIDSGAASHKLAEFIAASQRLSMSKVS